MATEIGKKTGKFVKEKLHKSENLFEDIDDEDDSSSVSEESVYSGLEEEPDSSDDLSNKEKSEDDVDSDDDDDDDDNDELAQEDLSDADEVPDIVDDSESDSGDEKEIPAGDTAGDIRSTSLNTKTTEGGMTVAAPDEYDYDSSDEEDIRNTIGNVPLDWYKEYSHIGYDVEGKKIIRPKTDGDELDKFLNKMDNPDYWRTVTNKMTGQNVVLSKTDLDLIKRLRMGKHPSGPDEMYQPWIEVFVNEVMMHPVSNRPEHKRSFIPSKWEKLKVGQMVHALKMGWMKPTKKKKDPDEEDEEKYFNIWKDDEEPESTKRYREHIPAPKMSLPGHAESYNPPPEYLFTEEEEKKWNEQEPEERRINFIPQKYSSLRTVPAYSRFINERFERCLDLYLCPRQRKVRMNINPEDLIPKLPKPKDLQPFPTTLAVVYKGHTDIVRGVSISPGGQWIVSASDDQTVRFWEISTGRCMKILKTAEVVRSVMWNPNPAVNLVAIAGGQEVTLVNPGIGDKILISDTDNLVNSFQASDQTESGKKVPVEWRVCKGDEYDEGYRIRISHPKEVSQVTWHTKGDYFATVMPKGESMAVLIHQLSRRQSQNPFSKSKGLVQCVKFHPVRPFLFVATQRYVRVYNLLKQELTKKLMTNCKWVSSMAVHSGGDNVIIGSYDCRMSWFDLDLSTKPYQTLRHHKKALRQVCYHKRYPLFASASDDGTVIVCHGMVYNDLLQNPLIVPVKVLKGHSVTKDLGVLDCVFHPTQPWIFTSGADGTVRLFT